MKDYNKFLKASRSQDSKFSLALNQIGAHFCGSIKDGKFCKGILFDNKMNYSTYSRDVNFHGYMRSVDKNERDILYVGAMRNKMPDGVGIIIVNSKVSFFGHFSKGIPNGRGYYFNDEEKLTFFGAFYSEPVYGTFYEKPRRYEGKFISELKNLDFINNPITPGKMVECTKIQNAFKDFRIKGRCSYFDYGIHEVIGLVQSGGNSQLTGRFEVKYLNNSIYIGELKNGSRHGVGYLRTNDGQFQLFGDFRSGNNMWGYLIIQTDTSFPEPSIDILIPRVIFGNMIYDSNGKISVYGNIKAILNCGSIYYGSFLNNSITGYGVLYQKIKGFPSKYTGQFYYGEQRGVGRLETPDYVYEGEFLKDLFHGYGQLRKEGYVLKGKWCNGKCLYASMTLRNPETPSDSRRLQFQTINIIFDQPTLVFEPSQMSGIVEIYLDQSLSQELKATYEALNEGNPHENNQGEIRSGERRGSYIDSKLSYQFEDIVNVLAGGILKSRLRTETNPGFMSPPLIQNKVVTNNQTFKKIYRKNSNLIPERPSQRNFEIKIDNNIQGRMNKVQRSPSLGVVRSRFRQSGGRTKNTQLSHLGHEDSFLPIFAEKEEFNRIFCFEGQIIRNISKGAKLRGIIRKFEDTFCVIETDLFFSRSIAYIRDDILNIEKYGEFKGFSLQGIGSSTIGNTMIQGSFSSGLPNGICIKSVNNKEQYIGYYKDGKKHGPGIKKNSEKDNKSTIYLYDFNNNHMMSLSKILGNS